MDDATKEKLSAKLKEKWASGTRKRNPPEMYERTAKKMREKFATGWDPFRRTFDSCSKGGKAITPKKIAANRRIATFKVGVPNPPGPSEAGVNNWKAKFWVLQAPDRGLVFGVNLNEIVRRNSHLFDARDLRRIGSGTYASKRLSDLFRVQHRKGRPNPFVIEHWKGWRACENAEMIKNVTIPPERMVMLRPKISVPSQRVDPE